jgi:oligosaccharyltransferase complex subunit beta
MTLVAGYQTQYNLRISLSGSLKMCSNAAMMNTRDPDQGNTIQSSSNYQLCTELVEWNLQERGVLKVEKVRHKKVGDEWAANPENYKRQVDIEYFIDIYEKKNGEWIAYNAQDIQF